MKTLLLIAAIGTPLIGVHYGANWTGGDLADRYGFLNHIGGMAGYKTNRNWYWCLDGNFMFGNDIRVPNLLAGITDSNGIINDINGGVGKVFLFSRGFNVNVGFGKLFFGERERSLLCWSFIKIKRDKRVSRGCFFSKC
jgi:hypothetical protein